MKKPPEYIEGPEAYERFRGAMQKVLTVSHAEIQRRIEVERTASALNPNRRGPKSKKKSASPGPGVSPPS
jgi:hypothetical protein